MHPLAITLLNLRLGGVRPVRGRAIRLEEGADMESGTPQGAVQLWPVLNIYRGANGLVHILSPTLRAKKV